MKDDKKLKVLRSILYKYPRYGWQESSGLGIVARMARDVELLERLVGETRYCCNRRQRVWELEALKVAMRYVMELGIPTEQLNKIASEEMKRHNDNWRTDRSNTPVHPNRARDNNWNGKTSDRYKGR